MSGEVYEKLKNCMTQVRRKTSFVPDIALVLGSGLGDFADNIKVDTRVSYSEIEGFPVSTAPGHSGEFIFGRLGSKKVVCMKGRIHYYEGYSIDDVVLPIRLMKVLGARILVLTNASGGVNPQFRPGDFMLLTDHISTFVPNPLRGENIPALGCRFPDMTHVYDLELNNTIRESAKSCGITLKEGVYVQTAGPSYETPAEIRFFRAIGADAVGMSTATEAIAGHHAGMKVAAISTISNLAAGISKDLLTEKEVLDAGKAAAPAFRKLLCEAISRF